MAHTDLLQCVEACHDCERACYETHVRLVRAADPERAGLSLLLADCADICRLAARLIVRESEYYAEGCVIAERICRRCADVLTGESSEGLQACAAGCGTCADLCHVVALGTAPASS